MAIIKCKMCGGDLNIIEGASVAECEYCGTQQTVPNIDNEKKLTLFARAGRLLRACEFDKAAGIFESLIAEFPEEAEAYWGLVLCKYGIEYVDDPATGKKIPTCHRSSFDSVMDDENFEQAQENADAVARRVYRDEAKAIEGLRKGIIEVSGKEAPYDIFICYKETDEKGGRTLDSVLAQDVYDALTEKGYRVFFSRITLEDKLGQEYEPYIFAALNSAKVMLAFGTDYEYYNAVWVKNEWSRFLQLIASGEKKTLIPCYKGIDAYDLPKEFAKLQAQDLGKVGAVQDLLRGIEKLIGGSEKKSSTATERSDSEAMVMRGQFALEDGDWKKADEFFERALDLNPQCSDAHLGKVLAALKVFDAELLGKYVIDIDRNRDFMRAIQFASPEKRAFLTDLKEKLERKYLMSRAVGSINLLLRSKRKVEERKAKARELEALREARARELEAQKIARAANIKKFAELRLRTAKASRRFDVCQFGVYGIKTDGTVLTSRKSRHIDVSNWKNIEEISAQSFHVLGLRTDGTVVASGENNNGECNVDSYAWRNIKAVRAGDYSSIGLRTDGRVVATGKNNRGQCDVSSWRDVAEIAVGNHRTVGLKSDGTVVAVGYNEDGECELSGWSDVAHVAANHNDTMGIARDGTVFKANIVKSRFSVLSGAADEKQLGWDNIVDVAFGSYHKVGLRADGTVVSQGGLLSGDGARNVSHWTHIIAIAAAGNHTIGLRADGTVVAAGDAGLHNVSEWRDIVAIKTAWKFTVGLKADGTLVATGENDNGQCDVNGWKLFNSIDTLDQEIEEGREAAREAARIAAEREAAERERLRQAELEKLKDERAALRDELAALKGLFTGKRRKAIEAKLEEINRQIAKLESESN